LSQWLTANPTTFSATNENRRPFWKEIGRRLNSDLPDYACKDLSILVNSPNKACTFAGVFNSLISMVINAESMVLLS
jgi:hypothetical protein